MLTQVRDTTMTTHSWALGWGQVGCDVTTIKGLFLANVAPKPQVPSVASHWSTLKSSISAASGGWVVCRHVTDLCICEDPCPVVY
mmetsp:Transcript_9270/g.26734  ORF Transcript_9270/g.26734 Transcript_9270/m.26734 type:complete len:85 (+) Transcript_9270:80-334(+)